MSNEATPPPRYGTRTNPRTGKPETYVLPEPVDLALALKMDPSTLARKELADVLHGGVAQGSSEHGYSPSQSRPSAVCVAGASCSPADFFRSFLSFVTSRSTSSRTHSSWPVMYV